MEDSNPDQMVLRQYLLGCLGEEEQNTIEERYMIDVEYFQELLIAEDDLVDFYLAGELSEVERRQFEHHFLADTERQQKLDFAKTLKKFIKAAGAPDSTQAGQRQLRHSTLRQRPGLGLALALALIILVLGATWVVVKNLWLPKAPGQQSELATVSATLSPSLTRDAGKIQRVTIAPDVATIQLSLVLATDEYPGYRVVVLTDEGSTIYTADELRSETKANGRVVVLSLPARLFSGGDYKIKLSGSKADGSTEDVAYYYLRVARTGSD